NAASASEDAAVLDDVRVRRALFAPQAFNEKQNTGVIEISPDTIVVARVDTITPAHVPELARVVPPVREVLTARRALEAAEIAGREMLAALKADPANVPEAVGSALAMSRIDPQGIAKAVADAAFDVPTGALPQ